MGDFIQKGECVGGAAVLGPVRAGDAARSGESVEVTAVIGQGGGAATRNRSTEAPEEACVSGGGAVCDTMAAREAMGLEGRVIIDPGTLGPYVRDWLERHGKLLKPHISKQREKELEVCFGIFDADGSGEVDEEEVRRNCNVCMLTLRSSPPPRRVERVVGGVCR